jgi:hypothetical protein
VDGVVGVVALGVVTRGDVAGVVVGAVVRAVGPVVAGVVTAVDGVVAGATVDGSVLEGSVGLLWSTGDWSVPAEA